MAGQVRYMLFAGLGGICLFYFLLWFITPFPSTLLPPQNHPAKFYNPPPKSTSDKVQPSIFQQSPNDESESESEDYVLPFGIITHRPALLTRLFDYMMKSTIKFNMEYVYVLEDGYTEETSDIIKKYGATRVKCENQIPGLPGLNSNYRCLMKYMHDNTPADSFVFLEEDLMLSPDFYSYFIQLTPVMQKDPTVFCVSTWADNGYELYAQDASAVTRIEHFAGYGWAISRKLYEEEIFPYTWELATTRMWDMYMQALTKDRVCLVPEIPRTHHASGNTGVTINQVHQSSSFDNIKLCDVPYVDLHPERLTAAEYDNDLEAAIRPGIFITCKAGILDYQNSTLLVYFKADSASDKTWNDATSWFGLWGTGNGGAQRGVSRGIVSFSYATNRVLIIGTYSPIIPRMKEKFSGAIPLDIGHAERGNWGPFGEHKCRKEPLFSPPEMKVVYGDKGDSCTQACEKQSMKCKLDYLPYVNYCEKQKEIAGACDECRNLRAAEPSFAIPFVREEGTRKICVKSHHEKWLNCDGVEKEGKRVCTCV